jgi:exopolyphosphatase / guanosine-5'-triphosphate,3'-diphosphate pyrophosphatase
MPKKFAIIDLGTGSVKSLIVEAKGGTEFRILHQERIEPLPGKGMLDASETVSDESIRKNIETLRYFISKAKKHGAKDIHIISTEVLRKARNKEAVLKKIFDAIGILPVVISQKREAELYWKGITADFPDKMEIAAIDIGGGSIQFMFGTKNNLRGHKLLQTGVFRLKEKFQTSDPFSEKDIFNIEETVREEISGLDVRLSPDTPYLHGSSAVIDFYKSIGIPLEPYEYSKSHPYQVDLSTTRKYYEMSKYMTEAERLKLSPNLPGFASAAIIGLANVLLIAEKTGLRFELPSNNNITQGIVRAIIEGEL